MFQYRKGEKTKMLFYICCCRIGNKQSTKLWWEAKIDCHNCESQQEMPPSNDKYEMIIHTKRQAEQNRRQWKTATCGETAIDESSSLHRCVQARLLRNLTVDRRLRQPDLRAARLDRPPAEAVQRSAHDGKRK